MTIHLHVSPSQVDGAAQCMRRWAWRYIAGIESPSNKFAARGSAVHGILEGWLLQARPPDIQDQYGRIAFSALEYLPAPMTPGLQVEVPCTPTFDGVEWSFRKDWRWPAPDGGVVIGDHKTCSNPDRYGHFPRGVLDREAQPITYAYDELVSGAPWVRLQWTDMTTAKPFRTVKQVLHIGSDPGDGVAWVTPVHVQTYFRAWNEFGRKLLTIRKKGVHPIKLPYNAGHCRAYGSECPYKSHCNLTAQEELSSLMTQQATVPNDANAFLARLATMAATPVPASTPGPTAAAPEVPVFAPAPPAPNMFQPPATPPVVGMQPPAAMIGAVPVFTPPPGLAPVNTGFQFPPPAVAIAAPPPVVAPVVEAQVTHFVPETPAVVQDTPVAQDVQQPKKRQRRTTSKDPKVEIQAPDGTSETYDVEAEGTTQDADWPAHRATIPAPAPDHTRAFRQDLVLAMAANPSYAALDSIALGNRLEVLLTLAEGLE